MENYEKLTYKFSIKQQALVTTKDQGLSIFYLKKPNNKFKFASNETTQTNFFFNRKDIGPVFNENNYQAEKKNRAKWIML